MTVNALSQIAKPVWKSCLLFKTLVALGLFVCVCVCVRMCLCVCLLMLAVLCNFLSLTFLFPQCLTYDCKLVKYHQSFHIHVH